jgi:hypothetical protein
VLQRTPTTVPVPRWPGLGAYPGSVLTITIFLTSPEIELPGWETVLDTATARYAGTLPGGPALLPTEVVYPVPQAGGAVPAPDANPLKLSGAIPPLRRFAAGHCGLQ